MRVLLVEDDERIVRFLFRRGLKAEGYVVDVARSGFGSHNAGLPQVKFSGLSFWIWGYLISMAERFASGLRSFGVGTPILNVERPETRCRIR